MKLLAGVTFSPYVDEGGVLKTGSEAVVVPAEWETEQPTGVAVRCYDGC